jgi:sulfhydrogenase subunit beta (sulfur reductase)
MERTYTLEKSAFPEFFESLKEFGNVFAPVRVSDQSFAFRKVERVNEIAFDALRTILPPKKFFYPQEEVLMKWNEGEFKEHHDEPGFQVIFGVHPCDLAGLGVLDTIYSEDPADSHYVQRRKKSLIVGLSCMPDKHCFCKSMGTECPSAGYDLFLTDIGDSYFIETRTAAGREAILSVLHKLEHCKDKAALLKCRAADTVERQAYKEFWSKRDEAFTNGFAPDNLQSVMEMEWDNPVWKELGERCLSCGNCTPVCPTCYCFDLLDIASLNGKEGERRRQWDSCQFVGFAQVAGDFNFRPTPVDRLKFWYRHKLHGFDDPYGFRTCVGCGRCTVSCPAGIDDLVQVVKVLQGKKPGYVSISALGECSSPGLSAESEIVNPECGAPGIAGVPPASSKAAKEEDPK